MNLTEKLTIAAILLGPIMAVAITLWIEGRRRSREQKIFVFRMLVATRHLPADPGFVTAINLIPVEFNADRVVLASYREFMEAVDRKLDGVNDEAINKNSNTKLTRLVYDLSRSLGFKLRETDIQTMAYASGGWAKRDSILLDSQLAMRDVASILAIQTKLLSSQQPNESEQALIDSKVPKL